MITAAAHTSPGVQAIVMLINQLTPAEQQEVATVLHNLNIDLPAAPKVRKAGKQNSRKRELFLTVKLVEINNAELS